MEWYGLLESEVNDGGGAGKAAKKCRVRLFSGACKLVVKKASFWVFVFRDLSPHVSPGWSSSQTYTLLTTQRRFPSLGLFNSNSSRRMRWFR